MKVKRSAPVRDTGPRRSGNQKPARAAKRQPPAQPESPTRKRRPAPEQRTQRPQRPAPQTSPIPRQGPAPTRAKSAKQAKARAKARKAKAPKVVRLPLRERLIARLATIDLNPRTLVSRVPFVVLVIGALGVGLGMTLWLSTDAAERSYQLGHARELNQALLQQKEALERDVLEAQAAPALAESARNLGMIPSRDTAHLVQDPTGNWMVVGTPKPAEGVPPPPLNTPLPDDNPATAAPAAPARPAVAGPPAPRVVDPREVVVRVPGAVPPAAVPLAAPIAPPAPVAPAPDAAAPVPVAPVAPEVVPPAVPVDGAPHLATPEVPAQPGPVGGIEQAAPAAPLGAPA